MVIKIKGIKSFAGLGRVLEYVATDKGKIANYLDCAFFHNVRSLALDDIKQEYEDNFTNYGNDRKGRNKGGQHVILSTSPLDYEKLSPAIMHDLMHEFSQKAYPQAKVFGAIHQSQHNYHAHLVVSPNHVAQSKAVRLSKTELKEVYTHMISYTQDKYPQLTQVFNMSQWGQKINSEKAYYKQKRNPAIKLDKETLKEQVQAIFRNSNNTTMFYKTLESKGYQIYQHKGENFGVRFGENKLKMRFSRLGIKPEHMHELDKSNTELTSRLKELEDIESNNNQKDKSSELSHGDER